MLSAHSLFRLFLFRSCAFVIFRVICHEVVFLCSFVVSSRLLFFFVISLRHSVCFEVVFVFVFVFFSLALCSYLSSFSFLSRPPSFFLLFLLFCMLSVCFVLFFFLFRKKIVCTFRGISGLPRILVLSRKVTVRLSFYDRSF